MSSEVLIAADDEGLDTAISVQGVSKCYQIYDQPHDRLKQSVFPRLQSLAGRHRRQYFREFWALRDVSFTVRRGQTVGIVGRNGSGKSTLLQCICGTLAPSSGTIETTGRVAALLELGAGFNPEFTGRENVYMSATVLGLTTRQVDERFDAIAAFADIGDFLDQPAKIYSSGMYVRLAFAVIAHVDADIMVVDEALAVGDAVFTQKCMRYIREFQKRGTLLFVSHDMGSVQNLCESGIWLDHGSVQMTGSSKRIAQAYLQYTLQETYGPTTQLSATGNDPLAPVDDDVDASLTDSDEPDPNQSVVDYDAKVTVQDNLEDAEGWKSGSAELISIELTDIAGQAQSVLEGGERVQVTLRARALQNLEGPILGFTVRDRLGQELFGENTLPITQAEPIHVAAGQEFSGEFVFRLPMLPNGQYAVMASVATGELYNNTQHHFLHDALILTVSSSKVRWGLVGIPFERIALKVINE